MWQRHLSLVLISLVVMTGCAEGPFWRGGKYTPWARNQWEAEARIADTLFVKKQRMTESVNMAINAPLDQQEAVAKDLAEVIRRDPILLLRLHAINLIGQLNCPGSLRPLEEASRDHNADVRIATIKAWQSKPVDVAVPALQEILGSDTNVDVRLAATRAIGNFSGRQAVQALSLALNDPDPAMQLRAAESLQLVTGEPLGQDIVAWQEYLNRLNPTSSAALPATESSPVIAGKPKRYDLR